MEATRGPFEVSDGLQRPSEGPSEGNRGSLRRPEAPRENAGVTRPGLHQRSGSYAQFWLSVADVFRAVAKKKRCGGTHPPTRPARVLLTRDAEPWKFQTSPAPALEKKSDSAPAPAPSKMVRLRLLRFQYSAHPLYI